ncbi:hypothetical protein OG416_38935 [Streptomyces longwoodensis]|uniref:hypothetical protein n=1 Tax=Streptomyces longwoodensis TaxID=68231 RepID=UPI0030E4C801|nr:hypothetical protein OG416_38935 [Streptomyces longwoodensis]
MSHPLDPRPYAPAAPLAPSWQAPVSAPLSGSVELSTERQTAEPVVYVSDAYGRMVPVLRSQADALIAAVPATAPRDLTPQPLLDSRAQLVIATGVGTGAAAAGVGWGLGQILAPLAALTSGGLLWAVCLAAVIAGTGRRTVRGGDTYVTHNHNSAKWWGKATSTTTNGR